MKKIIKATSFLSLAFLIIGLSFTFPHPISAGAATGIGTIESDLGVHKTSFGPDPATGSVNLVNAVLSFLTGVAAVWLLVTIVVSGMKIIQSAKSPEEFYTHMKRIMWAAVGMVVIALAYIAVSFILQTLFGKNIIENPVGELT